MSNARNLADLLNASGKIKSSKLDAASVANDSLDSQHYAAASIDFLTSKYSAWYNSFNRMHRDKISSRASSSMSHMEGSSVGVGALVATSSSSPSPVLESSPAFGGALQMDGGGGRGR